MSSYAAAPEEPITDFGKGIDLDAPRTLMPQGSYEDAQNMLLRGDESGRHLASMRVDVELDPTATWPDGAVEWFAPFTYTSYNATTGVLSASTHLLMVKSTGAYYRYDIGSPGTFTLVRRLPVAAQLTTHMVYDQWLVVMNGRDAPLKYGQHFLYDGQGEETPFLFPVGSKPISPLGPVIAGETWNTGTGNGFFATDAQTPGDGARVSTRSLNIDAGGTMTLTFDDPRDFSTGPRPYGGTAFSTSDYLQFQYLREAKSGANADLKIRFETTAGTDYFQFNLDSPDQTADSEWHSTGTLLPRSSVTTVGAPNWATINRISFINEDVTNDIWMDDFYFLYAVAPPAALVGAAHKDRLILGGVPAAGEDDDPAYSTVFYSDSAHPDEFQSTNLQVVSGGSTSLARTNRIMVLREYGDAVIVGTQNAIFAWTIGTDGSPSRSTITTETGMDSPRAVVETPTGSLIFPWQNSFYILRQTGRDYISEKIAPLMKDLWPIEPFWTMGVRDDKTKTIRFWWREKKETDTADPTTCNRGVVYDYVRSRSESAAVWTSQMTQIADYAVEAYVNGVRETLYSRYEDDHIHRMHVDQGGVGAGDVEVPYSVTLGWVSLQNKDNSVKWLGLNVPYTATTDVKVFVRYATHPAEFNTALYNEVESLPATVGATEYLQGRVYLGSTARWAQVKLVADRYGFELYPPLVLVGAPTLKQ